jgi:sugar lactone lactonase YvrE
MLVVMQTGKKFNTFFIVHHIFYSMTRGNFRVGIIVIAVLFFLVFACLPVNAADAGYRFVTKWGAFGTNDGQFTTPKAITLDPSGYVYVTDDSNRIQKFTSSGQFITKWGSTGTGPGQFNGTWGIAADSSGNVYVTDHYNHRVQKFTSDGNFITQWGSPGTGNGQFDRPFGIAADSAGNVYVVDQFNARIQKFTSSGQFIAKWGGPGQGDGQFFGLPLGIAVDSSGNVYVTEGFSFRIQKFFPSGQFLSTIQGYDYTNIPELRGIPGITVDAQGNIYTTESWGVGDGDNHARKFSPTGQVLAILGSNRSADEMIHASSGIAVDTAGNVYIVEYMGYNPDVKKFGIVSPSGTIIVTSNPAGADVFIDAVLRGTTPATFTDLTPGTHSVTVSKIGYLGSYSTITVSPQQPSTVEVTLQPLPSGTGIISVRSTPPGASIVLDGQYTMKTTPYDFYEVTPGVHTLEVSMLEYGTYTKTITVDPGTTVVVTTPWSYTEKDTVVFFSSDPDGANVYIDDSMKGVTPLSLHLKKGTYIVKMTKKDYLDDESALYVSSADPIQVTKTLETPGFESILALVSLVAVVLFAKKYRR